MILKSCKEMYDEVVERHKCGERVAIVDVELDWSFVEHTNKYNIPFYSTNFINWETISVPDNYLLFINPETLVHRRVYCSKKLSHIWYNYYNNQYYYYCVWKLNKITKFIISELCKNNIILIDITPCKVSQNGISLELKLHNPLTGGNIIITITDTHLFAYFSTIINIEFANPNSCDKLHMMIKDLSLINNNQIHTINLQNSNTIKSGNILASLLLDHQTRLFNKNPII